MVEFWACMGLACFDERFLNGLLKDPDATITKEMLRLSCFEFTELKRILKIPKVVDHMRILQKLVSDNRMCPLYPKPCPPPGKTEALFPAWAKEFEDFLRK
ncbi:MAG: hypothetical protein ACE145_18680 [Terriglobia bacterium]